MDDGSNQLFREYVRLLRGLQPKVLVMENVSGMVKGKMKLIFAEILRELKESGYHVSALLMNAMYYGVPQSRQRMIFIGVRGRPVELHPEPLTEPVSAGVSLDGCSTSDIQIGALMKPAGNTGPSSIGTKSGRDRPKAASRDKIRGSNTDFPPFPSFSTQISKQIGKQSASTTTSIFSPEMHARAILTRSVCSTDLTCDLPQSMNDNAGFGIERGKLP